jgi:dihydroxyacetone kinase
VDVVVVGEDCAIDAPGLAGRRGLAGTAFVHKVAGAAAAQGGSLEEVRRGGAGVGWGGVGCTYPVAEVFGACHQQTALHGRRVPWGLSVGAASMMRLA